jgi:hypothetical protein
MTIGDYYQQLQELAATHEPHEEGHKYVDRWDYYLSEKQYVLDCIDLTKVNTALEIGSGLGVLAFLLQQHGINVETSDCDADGNSKNLYNAAIKLLGTTHHNIKITAQTPLSLNKKYDLIVATRTVFDRDWTEADYNYFIADAMKYTNQLLVKTNYNSCRFDNLQSMSLQHLDENNHKPKNSWIIYKTNLEQ